MKHGEGIDLTRKNFVSLVAFEVTYDTVEKQRRSADN
jgi:hypothetical protein